jgi:hypothetical protein
MAVSICFGLLIATVLTLLYVPALYLIVVDATNLFVGREQKQMNVASDPEGLQRPAPRREGGMGKGEWGMRKAGGKKDEHATVQHRMLNGKRSENKRIN